MREQDIDTHYFAVMVPEGLFGLALIAYSRANPQQSGFYVAWVTNVARNRTLVPTLKDAHAFLHEAFGTAEAREISGKQYRSFLTKLRPWPAVGPFPQEQGVYMLPGGSRVRIGRDAGVSVKRQDVQITKRTVKIPRAPRVPRMMPPPEVPPIDVLPPPMPEEVVLLPPPECQLPPPPPAPQRKRVRTEPAVCPPCPPAAPPEEAAQFFDKESERAFRSRFPTIALTNVPRTPAIERPKRRR